MESPFFSREGERDLTSPSSCVCISCIIVCHTHTFRTGSRDETDSAHGAARQLGGSEIFVAILAACQYRLYEDPGPLQRFKLGKSHAGGSLPESRTRKFEGKEVLSAVPSRSTYCTRYVLYTRTAVPGININSSLLHTTTVPGT